MNSSLKTKHDVLMLELREELVDIQEISPTGSSWTCEPPVWDTDIDFVVMVEDLKMFTPVAKDLLWEMNNGKELKKGKGYNSPDFVSFRKDNINLIVFDNKGKKLYDRYLLATKLAKQFNLLKKEDRVALFEAVLHKQEEKPEPKLKQKFRPYGILNSYTFEDVVSQYARPARPVV